MIVTSNSSVQESSSFKLVDESFTSDKSSAQSVRAEEKMPKGAGNFEGDSGKNIGDREIFSVDQSIDSHFRAMDGPAATIPCQIEAQQMEERQHLANQTVSELAAGGDIPDPGLLARRLDEIENQIIRITDVYGNIPQKQMMRFKLAALYIQENFLTRMLYGMPSREEAFSKVYSLDNLLPVGIYGEACIEVLDLWWLPCNAKYFHENVLKSKENLKSHCELLRKTAAGFQLALDVLEKLKGGIPPEGTDASSSFAALKESINEKESDFKNLLEYNEPLIVFNLIAETGEIRDSEDNSSNQSNGAFGGTEKTPFELSKLDKIIIIFHHLYQEFNDGVQPSVVNGINVNILNNYFRALMSETELSHLEKAIAHFACLQTVVLSYYKWSLECMALKFGYSGKNGSMLKKTTSQQVRGYKRLLHEITDGCIANGFYRVADYWILSLSSTGFLLNYRDNSAERNRLSLILAAIEKSPKQDIERALAKYTCISIAEHIKDVQAFESIAENSANYHTFALLTMLWNDIGFANWPYSKTLNPERALEYLEFIQNKMTEKDSGDFRILKEAMSWVHNGLILFQGTGSPIVYERLALYYCISGEVYKVASLLEFAAHKDKKTYFGLAMASKGHYELAIGFLEKNKSIDLRIKAFLGVLYEKLIMKNNSQTEKHDEWHSKAKSYYQEVIKSRPEINKNLARVLEDGGKMKNALEHWIIYRSFLIKEAKEEGVRSVRFKISSELRLVSEKISELKAQLQKIENEFTGDQAGEPAAQSVQRSESEKLDSRRKRSKKKIQTATADFSVPKEAASAGQKKDKPCSVPVSLPAPGEIARLKDPRTDRELENEPEEADASWTTVTSRKPRSIDSNANSHSDIPADFSRKEVEHHWEITRPLRNNLTNRLMMLDFDGGDFDGALAMIDQYLEKITNPVARLHFIQNQEWLVRCKSFHMPTLYQQSSFTGQSIQELKVQYRQSILEKVCAQVEAVFTLFFQRKPSTQWFSNPEMMKEEVQLLRGLVHPEFFVQLGAQFSTAAHVMQDIYCEFSRHSKGDENCLSLYNHSPSFYFVLSEKFYAFRNFIDPSHDSDII